MTVETLIPISMASPSLPVRIHTVQSDTGREVTFVMTDLNIPSGASANIYAKKPSGAEIYNNCQIGQLSTGVSTVTAKFTSAMLEESGEFPAQIQVIAGSDVITSFVFLIANDKNLVNDNAAEGTNEYNALVEATQEALDAAQEALDAAAQVGDISSKTVTFQQAAQRTNIQSGDTLAVAFGKLAKYCADLKEAAYQGTANNLTTTEEGKVLDARQGKELKDQIGDLDELETSEKENLVGAVNELNTKTTPQGSFTGQWYPCTYIQGMGLAAVIPKKSGDNSLAITTARVFTASGWHDTNVLYVNDCINTWRVGLNDEGFTDITPGYAYLVELTGSIS